MKNFIVLMPVLALGAILSSPAFAEVNYSETLATEAKIDLAAAVQPQAPAADSAAPAASEEQADTSTTLAIDSAARVQYASADSQWWTFGFGVTPGFSGDSVGINATVSYSYFLIDGVEAIGEVSGWYYDQDGPDAAGVNPAAILRWHFWRSENAKTTVYADAGIGFVVFTNQVPFDGTSFNFTPRLGVGMTHQISDSGWRLNAGLRWNHVSNARINGDSENPSRDGPLFYAGVIYQF